MRIFMGIVWFVVFFIVLYIAYAIVLGVLISSGGHATNMQEGMQAGIAFAKNHAMALSLCRWGLLIAAIVFAALGSWKRVLPGTKEKKAVTAA